MESHAAPPHPIRYPYPHFRLFFTCLLFMLLAAILTGSGAAMFTDTDPLWHVAAGDLIRESGAIPPYDPWSYTAGQYRWLNIAWAWDTAMSAAHETGGWHAAIALNALTIAATVALIFAASLSRCMSLVPALLSTFGAITLLSLSLRPLQVSNLMAALWLLLLGGIARGQLSHRWLILFPFLSVAWVNTHGGFLLAPMLLVAFFIQAGASGKAALMRLMGLTLIASGFALLLNPYGIAIVEAVRRPLGTVANEFILEWQPFRLTPANIMSHAYVFIFLALAFLPRLPILPAERALAVLWCVLAFTANRYLSIFAIMAAPVVACGLGKLASFLPALPLRWKLVMLNAYGKPPLAKAACLAALALILWLPTSWAARYYGQNAITPPSLAEEIAFMRQQEGIRFLVHFNLASIVTWETHGQLPIFVDPRTETAFPPEVLLAYLKFHKGLPGWTDILETYHIGGVVLPRPANDPENDAIAQRFHALPGWYEAFSGPHALIFLRQNPIYRMLGQPG